MENILHVISYFINIKENLYMKAQDTKEILDNVNAYWPIYLLYLIPSYMYAYSIWVGFYCAYRSCP